MEIMSRKPPCDSQLGRIMLKFRPIAPKPPAVGAFLAADLDRAGTGQMMKRRRGGRKPKKIAVAVKKETSAVSQPPIAWVTMERVMAAGRVAASGEEIKRRLEADASPCFVSDAADRVTWINAAFRKMVLCEESPPLSASALMRVELVTRGMVPGGECGGFTCVARVRMGKVMTVVACDVWRVVKEGKWAWRLDVATALGLGLSCALKPEM